MSLRFFDPLEFFKKIQRVFFIWANYNKIKIPMPFIRKNKLILIIAFLAILTRLAFLGSSLWHNDAVDFVYSGVHLAATGEYDPAHSPDYPAWVILMAVGQKASQFFTGDFSPILMPNLITAVIGILTVILFYFLVRNLTGKSDLIAFSSSLILIFQPAYWLYSEIALSEALSVFLIILSLYFFDNHLRTSSRNQLILSSLAFSISLLARITNFLFMPVFVLIFLIYFRQIKERFNLIKALLLAFWLILLPFVLSLAIYGTIHQWDLAQLMDTSRRVAPSAGDLARTFGKLWLESIPLVFIFYLFGLIWSFIKKQYYFFSILLLPVIVMLYYYAGWWQKGSFDLQRYFVSIAPFISLGAGYGLSALFREIKKRLYWIIAGLLLLANLLLMSANLLNPGSCPKQRVLADYYLFPQSFCAINEIHFIKNPKVLVFELIDRELPENAAVVVGPDDWAFPKFFGNRYGLGAKKSFLTGRTIEDSLALLAGLLAEYQTVYLPFYPDNTVLTPEFVESVKGQNWKLKSMELGQKVKILVISEEN